MGDAMKTHKGYKEIFNKMAEDSAIDEVIFKTQKNHGEPFNEAAFEERLLKNAEEHAKADINGAGES